MHSFWARSAPAHAQRSCKHVMVTDKTTRRHGSPKGRWRHSESAAASIGQRALAYAAPPRSFAVVQVVPVYILLLQVRHPWRGLGFLMLPLSLPPLPSSPAGRAVSLGRVVQPSSKRRLLEGHTAIVATHGVSLVSTLHTRSVCADVQFRSRTPGHEKVRRQQAISCSKL